jgi:predicted small lipoprotein YifL
LKAILATRPLQNRKKKNRKEPFGSFLLNDEKTVVAALALAKSNVTTEREAARLFTAAARGRKKPLEFPPHLLDSPDSDLSPYVETYLSFFQTKDWRQAQEWVRTWVPQIARFDVLSKTKRAEIHREINEVSRNGYAARTMVSESGYRLESEQDTIADACVRAFMHFTVPGGWNPRRLAQCQFEECGHWFLRPEITRGKVRQFCSTQHASVARVRAFRDRRQKERLS